jgi:hypothetical protein
MNDRARRRLASLQKELKGTHRLESTKRRRIEAAIKTLKSDSLSRQSKAAHTPPSNVKRGTTARETVAAQGKQSGGGLRTKAGPVRTSNKQPVKMARPAAPKRKPLGNKSSRQLGVAGGRPGKSPTPKPATKKPATKITKPLPKTVNRNKPQNLMRDTRGTSVPEAEQRKFQKEQQLKARSKKAHQSPTARRATAAATKRKAVEKKHGKGFKKIPTRPPSRGAVAGKKIGKALKAKGSAAIAAFRKKAKAQAAKNRNKAPHKLKKIPVRKPAKKKPAKKKSWWDIYGK